MQQDHFLFLGKLFRLGHVGLCLLGLRLAVEEGTATLGLGVERSLVIIEC